MAEAAGIKMRASGTESHNSLGAGKRYHAVLRDLYQRVRASHPSIAAKISLALAGWKMNQTIGPQGLSTMRLVFGVHPRIPVCTEDLPEHREREKGLVQARADMLKHDARLRIAAAARQQVPAAADRKISAGMRVLVFRESSDLWEGPFTVVDCDKKQVWLDVNDRLKLFSLHQVKEYTPPVNVSASETASPTAAAPKSSASLTTVDPKTDDTASLSFAIDSISAEDTLLCRLSCLLGEFQHRPDHTERSGMYITEVLQTNDPRAQSPAMINEKKEEVAGLEARRTWVKVPRSRVPNGASIMGGRFVQALKNPCTKVEKARARFVLKGHMERDKPFVVINVPTPRQSSTRIVLSTSANEGFRLFLNDVNQAYLQSRDALPIHLKPRPTDAQFFDLDDMHVLRLKRPLYGYYEAEKYWNATARAHVKDDLQMTPLTGDQALFIKEDRQGVQGLLKLCTDDFFHGGNAAFQALTQRTLENLEAKQRMWDSLEVAGVAIKAHSEPERILYLGQERYVEAATIVPLDT